MTFVVIVRFIIETVSRTWVDRAARKVTQATDVPDSTLDAMQTSINGLVLTNRTATGVVATYAYDDLGLPVSITNALGHVSSLSYSTHGYLTAAIPAIGPRADFDRDTLGRLVRVRRPGPSGERVTAFSVDHAGRPTAVTNAVGQVSSFAYDWAGNLLSATDPAGRSVTNVWRLGKLVSTTRGPATIAFDYDPQMDNLAVRDPLGRIVERYRLDAAGRATSVTNLDGQVMSVVHGVGGMVKSLQRFDGSSITNAYDARGRLARVDEPDGAYEYAYLANDLPSMVTRGADTAAYGYDQWNHH